ncbi:hypothetical protein BOTBODRAFT_188399 [Botryobasidium botryosum FD-172 SS1]|uniref:Ubiquitin-like protease family profile domain-containing protein n=1 Tax=Botryobasidium botryosum (strain FD-172 SS1) TaxID=930990 RepID=A0A067MQ16_BOTB1|nr:hypothetical protein BOTBODRAFT_188399 [Botryobasidium botryosum FD-172 SS1]
MAHLFLQIMRDSFRPNINIGEWKWVSEKRPTRQLNTYDCGLSSGTPLEP